jgi:hypothetical protein
MKQRQTGPQLEVGDVVVIRSGSTQRVIGTDNIKTVSKSQRRITLNGRLPVFWYQQGSQRYVADPGAGIAGRWLNDYFLRDQVKSASANAQLTMHDAGLLAPTGSRKSAPVEPLCEVWTVGPGRCLHLNGKPMVSLSRNDAHPTFADQLAHRIAKALNAQLPEVCQYRVEVWTHSGVTTGYRVVTGSGQSFKVAYGGGFVSHWDDPDSINRMKQQAEDYCEWLNG